MKHIIYYATGNSDKFEEAQNCFKKHAPFIELKQLDVDTEEIQTLDQKAIALDKARKAFKMVRKPVLVDDAGVFFDKYPQFPGTLSKFVFKAIGFDGIFKLVSPGEKISFILNLAYIDGKEEKTFEVRCNGTIAGLKKGVIFYPKLPYMSIFKPNGSNKTYAELHGTPAKESYAFRPHAIKKFLKWYTLYHQINKEHDDRNIHIQKNNLESES